MRTDWYNHWFNIRKAAQVVAFFIASSGEKLNIVKLSKLVYLADRKNMEKYEYSITMDDLGSMQFGPVNSITRRYIIDEWSDQSGYWHELVGERQGNDIPLACAKLDYDMLDELSDAEIETLGEVWSEFGHMAEFDLAEWTHKNIPEWKDPNGSYIPIRFSDVYRALGKSDPAALNAKALDEREILEALRHP